MVGATKVVAAKQSRLLTVTQTTPMALWNGSADLEEPTAAIGWGVVGATCNPVSPLAIRLAQRPSEGRVRELARELPAITETETENGWKIVEKVSFEAAYLLLPTFEQDGGRNGCLLMQTGPCLRRDVKPIADQAAHFTSFAPNLIVKLAETAVAVLVIEGAVYRGVNINITVSSTVPQDLTTGEAIETVLMRRETDGFEASGIGPVVTIMGGSPQRLVEGRLRA